MITKHPMTSRRKPKKVSSPDITRAMLRQAINSIDSDGEMGMIFDDLQALHLEACKRAKPDAEELAIHLFTRYVNSGWDIFGNAHETYGRVLGKTGKAKYRELVEEQWQQLPRIAPGEKSPDGYGRSDKIERLMQGFAEHDGDLNAQITIMSRDLSEPYAYLHIAEKCRKARKYKKALEWAERGVTAFPDHHSTELPEFLASAYLRAKRPDEAMRVIWATFEQAPGLERYKCLATYAEKVGTWSTWRGKALKRIRKETRQRIKDARPRPYHWQTAPDHSSLVEIFLWERNVEEAWREAQKGGCSEFLWLRLAKLREKEHPKDAVGIYRRQIEPLLQRKTNNSYQEAVDFLGQIHKLMVGMNKEAEFKQDLLAIKTEWKRLRNFIKYVERRKWGK